MPDQSKSIIPLDLQANYGLDQLAKELGARTIYQDRSDRPGYLVDRAIPLLPKIKGGKAYLKHLLDAAYKLYDLIRNDPTVLLHIHDKTSVHREGATRGVLRPFRPSDLRHNIDALVHLLHSFAHIASRVKDRLTQVAIPLARDAFVGPDRLPLQQQALSQMVYALAVFRGKGEWAVLYPARYNDDTGIGLRTRLEIRLPFLDWLLMQRLVFVGHPTPKAPRRAVAGPILRIKSDDEGYEYIVPLNRDLLEIEAILPPLNAELAKQRISLVLPSYDLFARHFDYLGLQGRRSLYRQFRDEEGIAGRLYGHCVQTLPSAIRPFLQINGNPSIEADYRAMQLVLLYAEAGITPPEGDPYLIQDPRLPRLYGEVEEDQALGRSLMKAVLTMSVGNTNRQETVAALSGYLNAETSLSPGLAGMLYDIFWTAHQPVCPHGNWIEPAWKKLQYVDSTIALRVLRILYDQGVYAIPIHDSFIVQSRHEDTLTSAMHQAWQERYPKFPIGIRVTRPVVDER